MKSLDNLEKKLLKSEKQNHENSINKINKIKDPIDNTLEK